MRQFPESDWKLWRALSKEALERYCQKTLTDVARLERGEESAHARYLKLWKLLRRRDKEVAEAFDNPRRSTAYVQIALAVRNRIITRAELERFSAGTREVVLGLAEGF